MAGESTARRYARAAFELALEHGQSLDEWRADLEAIGSALGAPEVSRVLASPKLSFEQKRGLVDQAVGELEGLRKNFVYLLVDRGRIELFDAIRREFRALVLAHQGIAEATVTTAVPISDREADRVGAQLGRVIGLRVIVDRRIDPTIVGGMVARVGDTLINGSVAARLAALRAQLV